MRLIPFGRYGHQERGLDGLTGGFLGALCGQLRPCCSFRGDPGGLFGLLRGFFGPRGGSNRMSGDRRSGLGRDRISLCSSPITTQVGCGSVIVFLPGSVIRHDRYLQGPIMRRTRCGRSMPPRTAARPQYPGPERMAIDETARGIVA